eukprot:scaffold21394_cov66-Skeletonema_dohrnii-CCMP3373.AAC.1
MAKALHNASTLFNDTKEIVDSILDKNEENNQIHPSFTDRQIKVISPTVTVNPMTKFPEEATDLRTQFFDPPPHRILRPPNKSVEGRHDVRKPAYARDGRERREYRESSHIGQRKYNGTIAQHPIGIGRSTLHHSSQLKWRGLLKCFLAKYSP